MAGLIINHDPDYFLYLQQVLQDPVSFLASQSDRVSPLQFMLDGTASVTNSQNIDSILSCRPTLNYVNKEKLNGMPGWFTYDVTASMISALSLLLISGLILLDKRLQMHPNKLLAYACLCDAYGFCQFATRYMICGHGWSHELNLIYAHSVQAPMRKVYCLLTFSETY
jgi:hypothetical protein